MVYTLTYYKILLWDFEGSHLTVFNIILLIVNGFYMSQAKTGVTSIKILSNDGEAAVFFRFVIENFV
jgi:hypothetical protein